MTRILSAARYGVALSFTSLLDVLRNWQESHLRQSVCQWIPLAESVPRAKRSQIGMGNKSKEIAKLGNVQTTVPISVSHLEFGLNKAQQLPLAHRAFVVLWGALNCEFGHV
jgi:hypothetical protein